MRATPRRHRCVIGAASGQAASYPNGWNLRFGAKGTGDGIVAAGILGVEPDCCDRDPDVKSGCARGVVSFLRVVVRPAGARVLQVEQTGQASYGVGLVQLAATVPQVRDGVHQHGIVLLVDMANHLALEVHRLLLTFQGAANELHLQVIASRVEGVSGLVMKLEIRLQVVVYRPTAHVSRLGGLRYDAGRFQGRKKRFFPGSASLSHV